MATHPVDAELKAFNERRRDFEPYGFCCEKWQTKPMPRPDRHNEIELDFVLAGSLVLYFAGRRTEIPARRLALFWAARPHQIVEVNSSPWHYFVGVPLAMFLDWRLPANLVHAVLNGTLVLETRPDLADLDQQLLQQWYVDLQTRDPAHLEIVQLEIEARLRRLALTSVVTDTSNAPTKQRDKAPDKAPLDKVELMARYVAEHCTEPIQASDIGQAVGLHPDYAAALFRKNFGTTLSQFIAENRVSHAQYLLATTNAKILDVALDCGYQTVSRFNAVFKSLCGCTPREYRAQQSSYL